MRQILQSFNSSIGPSEGRLAWLLAAVVVSAIALACGRPIPPTPEQQSGVYIDPVVCNECHADVSETYRHTGMARSFYPANAATMDGHVGSDRPYYHRPSDRYYTIIEREGRYYQRPHQTDIAGGPTNVVEKEIHHLTGSGNHARTYLHLTQRGIKPPTRSFIGSRRSAADPTMPRLVITLRSSWRSPDVMPRHAIN